VNERNDTRQRIEQNLRAAIDTLHADMVRVEFWAFALSGFAQPIPDYEYDEKYRLKPEPKRASKSA
jgi:hypothetical protein